MSIDTFEYDTLVVGGGASGIAAAVSAAREGAKTALVERYGFVGGLATSAYVGTICGLFSTGSGKEGLIGNFGEEFKNNLFELDRLKKRVLENGLAFLPYRIQSFEEVSSKLLKDSAVETFVHSTCFSANGKNKLESINALLWNKPAQLSAKTWVDATGEGVLSRLFGAALIEDESYQAPGYVFGISGIREIDCERQEEAEKELSLIVLKELLGAEKRGEVAPGEGRFSVIPGSFIDGQAYFKFAFPYIREEKTNEMSRIEEFGRNACFEAYKLLRRSSDIFTKASLAMIAPQAGIRSGARGVGKYVLSDEDVATSRKFDDAVANGLWPVEFWGEKQKAEFVFFERDSYYQIPARCLQSKSIENLFFCGRGISATSLALSSARVIGTCLATGAAAGKLATA